METSTNYITNASLDAREKLGLKFINFILYMNTKTPGHEFFLHKNFLESEKQQEGHHQTEETHSLRQSEA